MPLAALVLALLVLLPAPARASAAWVWPLAGPHDVSRPFAPGPEPWSPGHRGADLPGEAGAPVLSSGAGRVSYAGLLAGRGVLVVVSGALRTTYEPVQPTVAVGAAVVAGQQVAVLEPGHAGCPVAACLHWGLLRGEQYLDPVRLVDRPPVRLLPRSPVAAALPARAAGLAPPVGALPGPHQPAASPVGGGTAPPGHQPLLAGGLGLAACGAALARRRPRAPYGRLLRAAGRATRRGPARGRCPGAATRPSTARDP